MQSNRFDLFIMLMIILNTVVLCMDFYGSAQVYKDVIDNFNLVFVVIFTIEAALKLLGLGPRYYFHVNWNKFDFSIVILSLVSQSP